MNLKMLSVSNNDTKLEEFCFSPLVYSHEVICKDTRVLFTTKSQVIIFKYVYMYLSNTTNNFS